MRYITYDRFVMYIDELQVLLALNGNARLYHLETEIFANESLATTYTTALTPWYRSGKRLLLTQRVYAYSRYIIGGRWPEAEECIMKYPDEWTAKYWAHSIRHI